jgi:hypothetical protein
MQALIVFELFINFFDRRNIANSFFDNIRRFDLISRIDFLQSDQAYFDFDIFDFIEQKGIFLQFRLKFFFTL